MRSISIRLTLKISGVSPVVYEDTKYDCSCRREIILRLRKVNFHIEIEFKFVGRSSGVLPPKKAKACDPNTCKQLIFTHCHFAVQ